MKPLLPPLTTLLILRPAGEARRAEWAKEAHSDCELSRDFRNISHERVKGLGFTASVKGSGFMRFRVVRSSGFRLPRACGSTRLYVEWSSQKAGRSFGSSII